MGLDMYLSKRTYVKNWDHQKPKEKHRIIIRKGGKIRTDIKPERISYIQEEVGYWRKANAIHKWFVDNCQEGNDDCRFAYVEHKQLTELYENCKTILASIELVEAKITNGYTFKDGKKVPILVDGVTIKNPDVAKELLPTEGGFFFGNTDYNQWYVEYIKETIEILKDVINDDSGDYYYQSSW
jgi:hypothetical protein